MGMGGPPPNGMPPMMQPQKQVFNPHPHSACSHCFVRSYSPFNFCRAAPTTRGECGPAAGAAGGPDPLRSSYLRLLLLDTAGHLVVSVKSVEVLHIRLASSSIRETVMWGKRDWVLRLRDRLHMAAGPDVRTDCLLSPTSRHDVAQPRIPASPLSELRACVRDGYCCDSGELLMKR